MLRWAEFGLRIVSSLCMTVRAEMPKKTSWEMLPPLPASSFERFRFSATYINLVFIGLILFVCLEREYS